MTRNLRIAPPSRCVWPQLDPSAYPGAMMAADPKRRKAARTQGASVLATTTLGTFDFGFGGDDHAESGAGNGVFIPPTFQSGRGRKRPRTSSHLSAPAAGRTGFGYVLAFTRYSFAQRFVCTNQ